MLSQDCSIFSKLFPWAEGTLILNFYLDEKICFQTTLVIAPKFILYFIKMQNVNIESLKKL